MKKEDQRKFSAKTLKDDFEKNILLKSFFKPAKKVKLACSKKYNSKDGLIHFKRRVDHGDEAEDPPAAKRQRVHGDMAQFIF
jgi:hypothetical protein